MTVTTTSPVTGSQFAAATIAFGAFLAAHPELPTPARVGINADGPAVTIYATYGEGRHDGTPAQITAYVAVWAAALRTEPDEPFGYCDAGGPYVMHCAEADIVPGVRIKIYLTAPLEPADTALALV